MEKLEMKTHVHCTNNSFVHDKQLKILEPTSDMEANEQLEAAFSPWIINDLRATKMTQDKEVSTESILTNEMKELGPQSLLYDSSADNEYCDDGYGSMEMLLLDKYHNYEESVISMNENNNLHDARESNANSEICNIDTLIENESGIYCSLSDLSSVTEVEPIDITSRVEVENNDEETFKDFREKIQFLEMKNKVLAVKNADLMINERKQSRQVERLETLVDTLQKSEENNASIINMKDKIIESWENEVEGLKKQLTTCNEKLLLAEQEKKKFPNEALHLIIKLPPTTSTPHPSIANDMKELKAYFGEKIGKTQRFINHLINENEEAINEYKAEIESLREENENLSYDIECLNEECNQLQDKLNEKETLYDNMIGLYDNQIKENIKLKGMTIERDSEIEKLQLEIKEYSQIKDNIEMKNETIELLGELQEAYEENSFLKSKLDEYNEYFVRKWAGDKILSEPDPLVATEFYNIKQKEDKMEIIDDDLPNFDDDDSTAPNRYSEMSGATAIFLDKHQENDKMKKKTESKYGTENEKQLCNIELD